MPDQNPLAQLQDIDLPNAIGWWPLSFGWWLLIALVVLLLSYLIYYTVHRYQRNRYKREALKLLQQLDSIEQDKAYIKALSKLLKRVALVAYPREQVASLHGQAWLNFLSQHSGLVQFTQLHELVDYYHSDSLSVDRRYLKSLTKQWILRTGGPDAGI